MFLVSGFLKNALGIFTHNKYILWQQELEQSFIAALQVLFELEAKRPLF